MRIVLMFIANLFRLPYMLGRVIYLSHHRDRYSREVRYAALHHMVRWANWGGRVRVASFGEQNIPTDANFIMYPNHQGLFDSLTMVQVVERPFSVVVKKELEHVYLLRNALQLLDAEYMDRADIRQSMKIIQSIAARVSAGENFLIFPEGTRSRKGNELNPFKPGSFKAAVLSKAAIVPVALVDCFIPFDEQSIRRVTVQVHFLKPIPYEEYKDMKTTEIALLVQDRIKAKIAEVTSG